jgi:hypothetical protein
MTNPQEERPVHLEDVPDEEGIDPADAVDRLEEDPEAQPNFTDDQSRSDEDPTDG